MCSFNHRISMLFQGAVPKYFDQCFPTNIAQLSTKTLVIFSVHFVAMVYENGFWQIFFTLCLYIVHVLELLFFNRKTQ